MLGRCAQDPPIPGEIALRQGCHDAALAGTRDTQANALSDGERSPDPGILKEGLFTGIRLHHNDGTLLYKRVGQREYGFSELNNFWGDSTIVLSDPTYVYHHLYGDWVELIMGISEMDVSSVILQDSTLFTVQPVRLTRAISNRGIELPP